MRAWLVTIHMSKPGDGSRAVGRRDGSGCDTPGHALKPADADPVRPRRGPIRLDGIPPLWPQRPQVARDLAWNVAELWGRSSAREQPRDPAPRVRPRDHALRPR